MILRAFVPHQIICLNEQVARNLRIDMIDTIVYDLGRLKQRFKTRVWLWAEQKRSEEFLEL